MSKKLITSSGQVKQETIGDFIKLMDEKIQSVRKHMASLDAKVEKTKKEWNSLKKNEIGLTVLENQVRNLMQQE
jgi:flagellar biosynthesis chaperone FliJ